MAGGQTGRRADGQDEGGSRTAPTAQDSVLAGVASLGDNSLLHRTEREGSDARYAMLETVREYALERLVESGTAAHVRARHACWFLGRTEEMWAAMMRGPIQVRWLDWADTEHDNLGAALAWLDEAGDAERLLRLIGAIWPFWMVRNHLTEWMGWVERGLPLADRVSLAVRARFLQSAAAQYFHYPGLDRRHVAQQALEAYQELGDDWGVATALHQRGSQALIEGRYDEAGDLLGRAVAIFEQVGAADWVAFDGSRLGEVALGKGDFAGARARLEQSLAQNRALDEPWVGATNLNNLALIAIEEERRDDAVACMREAHALLETTRDVMGQVAWLALAAMLAARDGENDLATRLFGARAAAMNRHNLIPRLPQLATYGRTLASLRARLGEPAYQAAFEAGRSIALDDAIRMGEGVLAGSAAGGGAEPPRPGGLTRGSMDPLAAGRGRQQPGDRHRALGEHPHGRAAHRQRSTQDRRPQSGRSNRLRISPRRRGRGVGPGLLAPAAVLVPALDVMRGR